MPTAQPLRYVIPSVSVAALLLVLFCAAPANAQGDLPKKNAHGTLTVAGSSTPLDYAYAIRQRNKEILILLSDQPLDEKELTDVFARGHRADADEIHTVEITFNQEKQPISVSVLHKAFKSRWGGGSTEDRFEPTTFDNTMVAGRAYRASEGEFNSVKYMYDATFSTALWSEPEPTFTGAAAKKSQQAKAALAFLKAGYEGNLDALKKSVVESSVGELEGENGVKIMEMMKLGPDPKTVNVTEVYVKGEDAEVVLTQDTTESMMTTTIKVKQERGVWKVYPR